MRSIAHKTGLALAGDSLVALALEDVNSLCSSVCVCWGVHACVRACRGRGVCAGVCAGVCV